MSDIKEKFLKQFGCEAERNIPFTEERNWQETTPITREDWS